MKKKLIFLIVISFILYSCKTTKYDEITVIINEVNYYTLDTIEIENPQSNSSDDVEDDDSSYVAPK